MKSRQILFGLMIVLAAVAAGGATTSERGPTYSLTWHSIDGGGGASIGTTYDLFGTIGQHDTGVSSGGGYTLTGGFLAFSGGGVQPCPADTDGSGDVGIDDFLAILGQWGAVCPCTADTDDDGDVDIDDFLAVLGGWGPCP